MLINIWKQAKKHNTVQQSPRRSTFKEHQFIMSIIYSSRTLFSGLGFSWLVYNFRKIHVINEIMEENPQVFN